LAAPVIAVVGWASAVFFNGAIPTAAFLASAQASPRLEGAACAHLNFLAAVASTLSQLAAAQLVGAAGDDRGMAIGMLACLMLGSVGAWLLLLRGAALLPAPANAGAVGCVV